MRYLSLIAKNSWRNRRRTTLTILSVAASLSLLGVFLAIYFAFYLSETPPDQALRIAVRNRVSLVFSMPAAYAQKIERIPGVRSVMAQQWFGGKYKDDRPENMFARFAIEPEKLFTVRSEMKVGDDQKKAFLADRTAAMFGAPLAQKLGLKVGDRITLVGDIFPVTMEFRIAALFDAPENNEEMYFHRKYLEETVRAAQGWDLAGQIGMFVVLADSADSVPRICSAIDGQFKNSPTETKSEPERQFALGFVNALGNVKAFLLSICAAVTFTILLVCANTISMSVRERTREVGILKTLGFTKQSILGMILGEAVIVSLAGGAVGLLIASGLCAMLRQAPAFIDQLKTLSIPPPVAALCLLLAAAIGLASAFVPAYNAARVSILDALKGAD